MEIKKILEELKYSHYYFPKTALDEAITKKDEITPHLLKIIEDATLNLDEYIIDDKKSKYGRLDVISAMFLLAIFREKRAYELILNFLLKLEGDIAYDLLGDFITEKLANVIASVYDGDYKKIYLILKNNEIEEFTQVAIIDSLVISYDYNEIGKDEIIIFFKELFQTKIIPYDKYIFWEYIIRHCINIAPKEFETEILKFYENEEAENFDIDLETAKEIIEEGIINNYYPLDRKKIEDIEEMDIFSPFDPDDFDDFDDIDADEFMGDEIISEPIVRTSPKVGRNEPCPCGSGKKYKKCCGG
ncbi:MAG TPA: DUF1186 domain-containing protein [Spirochaetota bacterium]|nr:DUF1186 domain-containing protein [Spirochaetota bacterium]